MRTTAKRVLPGQYIVWDELIISEVTAIEDSGDGFLFITGRVDGAWRTIRPSPHETVEVYT